MDTAKMYCGINETCLIVIGTIDTFIQAWKKRNRRVLIHIVVV